MSQEFLFHCDGDVFTPTPLAGSPWNPGMLHGGAPAGLLAHYLENGVGNASLQPARLSIDLIRPVPNAPLQVVTRRIREGKRIVLEEGRLEAGGKTIAIATALFVQAESIEVPVTAPRRSPLEPLPDQLQSVSFRDVLFKNSPDMPPGLHTTVILKPISHMTESGQGKAWLSLPVPVIDGQINSPFMLAALMSDFCNGVGQLKLAENLGMINADIHLQLFRAPVGDWIGIDAQTLVQANGLGMVTAELHDVLGLIGQVNQTVMPMPEFKAGS